MSLGTSNRDGGKTSESGHLRAVAKMANGAVANGLNVTQRAAGANMSVDIAVGDAFLKRSDGSYAHPVFNDAVLNQVITTADGSNPRRDILVMYLDYAVTPSTAVSNNINNVVKVMVVAGTPAGSPVDPTNAAIQSAVGAGNPYTKLARIRVPAGQTSISNSLIDDLRLMATGLVQGGWVYDDVYTWVYASASTFTVAGVDVTAQFPVGTKLALYQSGSIKYFTVVSSAFSTNTTITVDGQGTYTLASAVIDKPAYSYAKTPSGFPAGEANVPFYNPYKFSVYCSAGTSIANTTLITPFQTELFDTSNSFASNKFTAPVSGYYQINAQVFMGTAGAGVTENAIIQLRKNGSTTSQPGSDRMNGSGDANRLIKLKLNVLIALAVGDYIEIASTFVGSRDIAAGADSTWFNGYLVSRL